MLGVSPYLAFKGNCREAIEFYKSGLGAEVLFVQTVGESPLCQLGPAQGTSTIMMGDDPNPDAAVGSGNISLAIGLNDAERAKQIFRNLAQDGSVVMELEKTYWAEAFGMVTDKFGVKWLVNCEAPQ